jgi:segregation and condensation protein A
MELVRQLLEYQTYKEASLALNERPQLERDTFKRGGTAMETPDDVADVKDQLIEVSLFDLVEAFQRIITKTKPTSLMEIEAEKITLTDKIAYIKERLRLEKSLTFVDLLEGQKSRRQLIYTFLAILELVKMRVIGAYQSAPFAAIRIFLEGEWDTGHE